MKKHLSKRRVVVSALIAVLLAIASGVAYAYWTSTATGTGTASAAAASGAITVTGTVESGIYPGGSKAVHFTAANSSTTSAPISSISLTSVSSSNSDCNTLLGTEAGQFSMDPVGLTGAPVVVPAGATALALAPDGLLKWLDASYSQNACKIAPLTLTFAVVS